ncbi:hypothetical protein E8E13_011168 [Curvularia kusanoi]|uniref:Uncharacterized protein n=1 Tax=Curvularia kusanoi TaxID=90978 RepID=A0A9P4TNW1_CURKU|nr:hypothetical protein E8E13_011168 [Curvularia kusanoi]
MAPVAAAGQRALSTLAKRLHPQLPLTPRESQQLLNLLTTSFRAHLDREHPVHTPETAAPKAGRNGRDSIVAPSSAALASQHLDAVLSNPLFAVKPSRRGSQSGALQILKDPIGWFLNEMAMGRASLSKVSTCLDILDRSDVAAQSRQDKKPGAVIGGWLHSSGLDASTEFLETCVASHSFLSRLVTLLLADGETRILWKWFARPYTPGLSHAKVLIFKKQILRCMVHAGTGHDLPRSLLLFERAHDICQEQQKGFETLRTAGQYLVHAIVSKPTVSISHELYDAFRKSTAFWIPGPWAVAVDAMLWLRHPLGASFTPGIQFIQDPAGAATFAKARTAQRSFVVQLSLGVARELLAEERYEDAQVVMAFIKQYFPDLVLTSFSQEPPRSAVHSAKFEKEQADEVRNLELLEGLLPA